MEVGLESKISSTSSLFRIEYPVKWSISELGSGWEATAPSDSSIIIRIFMSSIVPRSFVVLVEDHKIQAVDASLMMAETIKSKFNIDLDGEKRISK